MLDVNQILMLRGLALAHLPKLRDLYERNARFGRLAAEQTLDSGWRRAWLSPLATGIERQAAQVLAQVYMHPETALISHSRWNDGMDQESIENAESTLALLREHRAETESALLEEVKKLCMLSSAPLPLWMKPETLLGKASEQQVSAEVPSGRRKWTDERLRLLLDEHKALKASRHPSPTRTLAKEHGVSDTVIRRQLTKAKALVEKASVPRPATFCDALWHE